MRSKFSKPPLVEPGASVLLVGNGPGLMLSRMGKEIDSFDEIFRFNEFRIKGFEEHVGSRTTVYCTFGRGMLPGDPSSRPEKVLLTFGRAKPAYPANWEYTIAPSYFTMLSAELRRRSNRPADSRLQPSSGFLVARWLLDSGQVKKVSLAGFDHFQKDRDKRHHYWINRRYGKPKEHDGDLEKEIMAEYERAGEIVYIT